MEPVARHQRHDPLCVEGRVRSLSGERGEHVVCDRPEVAAPAPARSPAWCGNSAAPWSISHSRWCQTK